MSVTTVAYGGEKGMHSPISRVRTRAWAVRASVRPTLRLVGAGAKTSKSSMKAGIWQSRARGIAAITESIAAMTPTLAQVVAAAQPAMAPASGNCRR